MPTITNIAAAAARPFGHAAGTKKPVTVRLTSSQTWVAPLNVAVVDIKGRGGDGAPGGSYTETVDGYNTYYEYTIYNSDGSVREKSGLQYSGFSAGTPPADYCQPPNTSISYCYYHAPATGTRTVYYQASAGGSSQAMGKTFAGGSGGTAPDPATYQGVTVTPGGSYPIVIGAATGSVNGWVEITYLQ